MAAAGDSVPLFGNGWDDRELVNAYDAALLEFHIHHPGPGSWLDKATAALAKGQPLPGSNAFDSAWYSASANKEGTSTANPRKRQRTESRKNKPNPYKAVEAPRAESPTYQPASPGAAGAGEQAGGEEGEEGDDGQEDDEVPDHFEEPEGYWGEEEPVELVEPQTGEQEEGQVFPPPSGSWPGLATATHDEAVGYALNAQYWAGYWMGVARGAHVAQQAQARKSPSQSQSQSQPKPQPPTLRR